MTETGRAIGKGIATAGIWMAVGFSSIHISGSNVAFGFIMAVTGTVVIWSLG